MECLHAFFEGMGEGMGSESIIRSRKKRALGRLSNCFWGEVDGDCYV